MYTFRISSNKIADLILTDDLITIRKGQNVLVNASEPKPKKFECSNARYSENYRFIFIVIGL